MNLNKIIQNIKFSYKILLLPTLFMILLVGILILFNWVSGKNNKQLGNIQNGYIPYSEMSLEINMTMKDIQRGFQDAVAIADNEKLDATKVLKSRFDSLLTNVKNSSVLKGDTVIQRLSTKFSSYYDIAYATSEKMILGDYSEETSAEIQVMVSEYQGIIALLDKINSDSKIRMKELFEQTRKNNTLIERVMILSFILLMIVIAYLAYTITLSTVKPLTNFVNNLNELSEGSLRIKINKQYLDRKDEIGKLSQSLQKMILDAPTWTDAEFNDYKEAKAHMNLLHQTSG